MADCSLNGLSVAAKCFDCFSLTEKQALKSKFLADALLAFGGPDLTNKNVKRQAVACFQCEPDFRIDSMDVVIAQRLAVNAGASASVLLTPAQLRSKITCARCGDTWQSLTTEVVYLRCLLNKYIGSGAQ